MAVEVNSATWIALNEHIEKELTSARTSLEIKGLDVADTEFERGRIKALRSILSLGEPPKPSPEYDPL
jgi:hypothetical protein